MSYHDLRKGSPDQELGKAIYLGALAHRRGFRDDQIGIEDNAIWREIFEEMGAVARKALAEESTP